MGSWQSTGLCGYVIDGSMPVMATLTETVTKAVGGILIHSCTTVMRQVRPTQYGAQTESNGNPDNNV